MEFNCKNVWFLMPIIILIIVHVLLNNLEYIYSKGSVIVKGIDYSKIYNQTDVRLGYVNSKSNTISRSNANEKIFRILAWTNSYYGPRWHMEDGSEAFEMCEYKNCIGTRDKDLFNQSDAILFHMRFMNDVIMPMYRFPFQKWIMHIRETPYYEMIYNSRVRYNTFNNVFNTTWTYNRKSDIWTNYSHPQNRGGLFVRTDKINSGKAINRNYAAGKTKQAVWLVSNCKTYSGRDVYVKNLQEYMNVDVYGACGTLECDKTNMSMCMEMIERDYKFFLAFENSLCDDYVTEKLWNAINRNIVPIVLGAYKYSELLPPKSYIDVKDYKSPKELADYLNLLDENDTMYNEYLEWKENYVIVQHPPLQCNVCEYLNQSRNVTKSYEHLDEFWNANTDCYSPKKFYKSVDVSS